MRRKDTGYKILNIFLIAFLFYSCIESFKPVLDENDTIYQLVVEGRITNETGPFKTQLTKSGSVYTYQDIDNIVPADNANVQISDDKGNVYQLYQVEDGWYETEDKNLKGVPGNTYTLHITEEDGTYYESTPELMLEVSPIDSIFFTEEQRIYFVGEKVYQEVWLNILLNTQASGNSIHYFKWEFEETWEFKMPENITVIKHSSIEDRIIDSAFMKVIDIATEKLHCWASEASRSILVKSTANNLSGEIKGFQLTSIGPDEDKLSIRYSILVKQYDLNYALYDFFIKLKDLNETSGGIYSKIPTPVYGNIKCVSENKKALGYFYASAVKTKRIFIDNTEVNIKTGNDTYCNCGWEYPRLRGDYYFYGTTDEGRTNIWSKDKYCTDCRERGTNVKPDFWE